MAKKKPQFKIDSYGTYKEWDRNSGDIPKLVKIGNEVIFNPEVEFGLVLNIKAGKGIKLTFKVIHPNFKGSNGQPAADFLGEHYVNGNTWQFFLGDTVWEPYDDKCGIWRFIIYHEGKIIADKTLDIIR